VVAQVGIAGSVTVGRGVMIGGQAGLAGHLHVGDGAKVMAKAGIMGDVEPGAELIGAPSMPRREFFRQMMFAKRMPEMYKQLKELRAQMAELEAKLGAAADDPT
jgi:UDP-3-O-[3-hydroxymyristoyl] glucosamine N-acyltransferase